MLRSAIEGGVAGREQDSLSLVGGPLAASTPTAAGASQPPMYHTPHLSTHPIPQYGCEAVPYSQPSTPSYSREMTFVPITSAYRQDLCPLPESYTQTPTSQIPTPPTCLVSLPRTPPTPSV
ncbi:hypothetical protein GWK47_013178 [Chionoecetes opilio]|uniref:Uncharacterized protein n=1 Tax=Chionoecetes opilio TaxID=41210 RepID=A0A8J5CLI0_CHIOP|nr:hypothetical protein GWK47_013178 [Chionoecetes opilio]